MDFLKNILQFILFSLITDHLVFGQTPCNPNPCENGGTCTISPDGKTHICTCPQEIFTTTGGNCENVCNATFTEAVSFEAREYRPNQVCTFTLRNPSGRRIHFGLHYQIPCSVFDRDSLVVYDGTLKYGLPLINNCDVYSHGGLIVAYNSENHEFHSSGDTLTIQFESNGVNTRNTKLSVNWIDHNYVECSNTIHTSEVGSLTSPNYPGLYEALSDCKQVIQVTPGSLIKMVFTDLHIEPWYNCIFDRVLIYDGTELNQARPHRICGTDYLSTGPLYLSHTNTVTIHFLSDESSQQQGFRINWEAVAVNECESSPCLNGGTCVDGVWQYTCQCALGWKGTHCEHEGGVYTCAPVNPCANVVGDLYLSHPDPTRFVQCGTGGRCHEMPCPGGLFWSQANNICDVPDITQLI